MQPDAQFDQSPRGAGNARLNDLESRVDRLAMLCCAMWPFIQSSTDAPAEELIQMVREIDLADGYEDGKAHDKQVYDCHACRRPVSVSSPRCLYCGAPRRPNHPFESVL